jgi:hypothetical protein
MTTVKLLQVLQQVVFASEDPLSKWSFRTRFEIMGRNVLSRGNFNPTVIALLVTGIEFPDSRVLRLTNPHIKLNMNRSLMPTPVGFPFERACAECTLIPHRTPFT